MSPLLDPGLRASFILLVAILCITGLAAYEKIGEQSVATLFGSIVTLAVGAKAAAELLNGREKK